MKDHLLPAQACLDWTVSQLPSFDERISKWLRVNVNITTEDAPAPETHNPVIAFEKEPFPLAFNVEFGAYISTLRSSLDILACAIGKREMVLNPDRIYFPVADSPGKFAGGEYRGVEFVKQLSGTSRKVIELLQPYKGGNEALFALHHLDIVRKHRRLIEINTRPLGLTISGFGDLEADLIPVNWGNLPANQKTVIAKLRKGAPNYNLKFTPIVTISEPGFALRKPIIATLYKFASLAESIIKLFDGP